MDVLQSCAMSSPWLPMAWFAEKVALLSPLLLMASFLYSFPCLFCVLAFFFFVFHSKPCFRPYTFLRLGVRGSCWRGWVVCPRRIWDSGVGLQLDCYSGCENIQDWIELEPRLQNIF